jgi:uncharacterized membrane protein
MKSNYLEDMISQVSKESEKSLETKNLEVNSKVKNLNKSWRRKYFLENRYMPLLCLILILDSFLFTYGIELFFTSLPIFVVSCFIFSQAYMNTTINKLDLSMSLTQYGERQLHIYKNQLSMFEWFRWIIYPLLGSLIVWEFAFRIISRGTFEMYLIIILKIIGMGGIYWFERKSVEELRLRIISLT